MSRDRSESRRGQIGVTGSVGSETNRLDAVTAETATSRFGGDGEPEVMVIRWPEQQDEYRRATDLGIPRLLLLAPDDEPPTCRDCLEDWIRLPVEHADFRARMLALAEHRHAHRALPEIDEYGIFTHEGKTLFLSPREHRLAEVLLDGFGTVVTDDDIEAYVFADPTERRVALRVHVSRLRKHLSAVGLTITCVRSTGYIMHHSSASPTGSSRRVS